MQLDTTKPGQHTIDCVATDQAGNTATSTITGTFKANLIAWLADATNGIQHIVAQVFTGERVETRELCVGSTCVSEDQFKAMVGGSAAGTPAIENGAPSDPPASGAEVDADELTIAPNGDNPATTTSTAASSTPPVSSAADDGISSGTEDGADPAPIPQAANDNPPALDQIGTTTAVL